MIFLKKIHGNMIFSANVLKRRSFKKMAWEYGLSFIIMKGDISFSQKYDLIL